MPNTFESLPQWRNFAKSGHTVRKHELNLVISSHYVATMCIDDRMSLIKLDTTDYADLYDGCSTQLYKKTYFKIIAKSRALTVVRCQFSSDMR